MDVVVEEAAYGVVVDLNGVVDIDKEALATSVQLAKLPAAAATSRASDPACMVKRWHGQCNRWDIKTCLGSRT